MLKKYNWGIYFVYALILFGYIMWSNKIVIFLNEQGEKTFKSLLYMGWAAVIFIVLGIFMGLERWLLEWRKKGEWKLNLPKISILGIPSLYFSLSIFIFYCPNSFIRNTLSHSISIFLGNSTSYIFLPIFQVILGYVITTSFYKTNKEEA